MSQAKPDDVSGTRSAPRAVLLATDRSQSIIGEIVDGQTKTIGYSAYGEQSAQQKVETRLGFNGQLREADIGWYLLGNGYRAYNPRLMRFHSPDSWSPFRGGGLNAYMYCVGDPVNRVDPTGHSWQTLIAKLRSLASEFHLPNYRAVPVPKNIVSIADGAAAARAMHKGQKFAKTSDMSALTDAADYIGGKKPKINWGNDGGELHGTAKWGTDSFPNHVSIEPASSGSKRSIPVVGKSHAKTLSGRPSNFGSPPSYEKATSKLKLWNANTFAESQRGRTFVVASGAPHVNYPVIDLAHPIQAIRQPAVPPPPPLIVVVPPPN
ncbi:RHS repeat-associated core domain-containing protein [Pseudomonas sp. S2_D06]